MLNVFIFVALQSAIPLTLADTIRIAETEERERRVEQRALDTLMEESRKMPVEQLNQTAGTKLAEWRECLRDFSTKTSIVLADSTPTVADISFLACKDKQGHAEWAAAKSTFMNSSYKPDMATAYRWTKEEFNSRADSERENLLVSVSYTRQIQYIKTEKLQTH
jgi:hypothetical protein